MENLINAQVRMRNRCPFRAASLKGELVGVLAGLIPTGQLPAEHADRLHELQAERADRYMGLGGVRDGVKDAPVYVVSSYGTPIAWVTQGGDVVIPEVTYSPTTTRHQKIARRALADA
ncbi:hypothetical protein AB0J80_35965 [Actinoplanes sp. NPDC049548]|uniref:hypothetical protein n=1 Tax=Actinoplanes sp. NPDC049548 TaxID=3155152 RepID=UPI0034314296